MSLPARQPAFENVTSEEVYPLIATLTEKVSHAIEGAILHIGTHPIFGKTLVVEAAMGASTLCYPFES